MNVEYPFPRCLVACFLVTMGCGNSSDASGTGGTASGTPNTGGAGGGVSSSAGGVELGGTSSAGQPSTGGRENGTTGGTSGASGAIEHAGSGGENTAGANAGGANAGGANAGGAGRRSSGGVGGAPAGGGSNASGGAGHSAGGPSGGASAGGRATMTGGSSGSGASGGSGTTVCTASKAAGSIASGSGPHQVTVETNADTGINEGTIFRPTDLGGSEKYPILVWGEGGCSENGLSNSAAMGEIASHGYFVIADGTPNGSASRAQTSDVVSMAKPLLAYIDWAIAENEKPCSAYYQSLDTTKIMANGFSCGGLMAEGTAADSRITTWGLNSSGLLSPNQAFYKTVHTPVLIVLGGSGDIAYQNGENDYTSISALGMPIMLFSKALGHGGDLFSRNGGDFTKIDVAWLNWWLKGDETATGKGLLVGSTCSYCSDSAWEVKSANLP